MRLYEFAKQQNLKTADVSAAAKQLKFNSAHGSSKIDGAELDQLLKHFGVREEGEGERGKNSDPGPLTADPSLFDGSPFFPTRLFKYAKRRGLTLQQAIDGATASGLSNPHRHRDLDSADIAMLDAHFLALLKGE